MIDNRFRLLGRKSRTGKRGQGLEPGFFLSKPVIIRSIEAARTKRKEIKTASKVGNRK